MQILANYPCGRVVFRRCEDAKKQGQVGSCKWSDSLNCRSIIKRMSILTQTVTETHVTFGSYARNNSTIVPTIL